MRVSHFEILVVRVPLRVTVRHSLAERCVAENVVVVAVDESGVRGHGETCPRPYVTGESIDGVCGTLASELLPPWTGREVDLDTAAAELSERIGSLDVGRQAAFCAAELAVLDLAARMEERPAGDVVGPVIRPRVRYSGVIATEDRELLEYKFGILRAMDARHVKVKVGESPESNRALLALVRQELGDGVSVRLDVNCAWTRGDAVAQLEQLVEFGLDAVEQPLPKDDIDGLATLTAAGIVPIVADESICSFADAQRLIDARACDVMNVRIAKCGGLLNSARIHRAARTAGMKSQLGAQVGELGFLSAAGRQFATRLEGVLWREGSFGDLLLEHDVVEPPVKMGAGGLAEALPGPGLGVTALESRLKEYTVASVRVE